MKIIREIFNFILRTVIDNKFGNSIPAWLRLQNVINKYIFISFFTLWLKLICLLMEFKILNQTSYLIQF